MTRAKVWRYFPMIILPVSGQTTTRHFLVEDQWQRLAKVAIEDVEGLVRKDVGVEEGAVGSSEKKTWRDVILEF